MDPLSYETPEVKETEKFYKRSLWWIAHRDDLKKIGLGLWIALDAFLVTFAVWMVVDTFLIQYEAERGLLRSLLVENPNTLYATSQAEAATPLVEGGAPAVIAAGEGTYDFVGSLTNPNDDWWAEVVYQFTYGADASTDQSVALVYPRETTPVLSLGAMIARPSNAKLRVLHVRWHRVDPHAISDFVVWKRERLDMKVSDAAFIPLSSEGREPLGRVSFTVANQSAFGYWSAPFAVLLKRGSAVVGAGATTLEVFETGETRRVDLTWFGAVPGIDAIDVVPLVNIFDASNYLPPRSEASLDTRTNFGQ